MADSPGGRREPDYSALGRRDFAWLMSDRRREILTEIQREIVLEVAREPPTIAKAIAADAHEIAGRHYFSSVQRWCDVLSMVRRHSPALADRINHGLVALMLEDDDR